MASCSHWSATSKTSYLTWGRASLRSACAAAAAVVVVVVVVVVDVSSLLCVGVFEGV